MDNKIYICWSPSLRCIRRGVPAPSCLTCRLQSARPQTSPQASLFLKSLQKVTSGDILLTSWSHSEAQGSQKCPFLNPWESVETQLHGSFRFVEAKTLNVESPLCKVDIVQCLTLVHSTLCNQSKFLPMPTFPTSFQSLQSISCTSTSLWLPPRTRSLRRTSKNMRVGQVFATAAFPLQLNNFLADFPWGK